jgi:anaerobic selenocysteine-containing dehydrogenase
VAEAHTSRKIPGYCALCRSRCGCVSVVENGRLVAVEPYPDHPTGQSLCGKGRAAPELVYSADRLLYPMKRTRPKGDSNPGWQRISWDEALDRVAKELTRLKTTVRPALLGEFSIETVQGTLACPIAFEMFRRLCASYPPERAAQICWVAAEQIRAMARMLHESGPVSYYGWTGVGEHTHATQTDRAK